MANTVTSALNLQTEISASDGSSRTLTIRNVDSTKTWSLAMVRNGFAPILQSDVIIVDATTNTYASAVRNATLVNTTKTKFGE